MPVVGTSLSWTVAIFFKVCVMTPASLILVSEPFFILSTLFIPEDLYSSSSLDSS